MWLLFYVREESQLISRDVSISHLDRLERQLYSNLAITEETKNTNQWADIINNE